MPKKDCTTSAVSETGLNKEMAKELEARIKYLAEAQDLTNVDATERILYDLADTLKTDFEKSYLGIKRQNLLAVTKGAELANRINVSKTDNLMNVREFENVMVGFEGRSVDGRSRSLQGKVLGGLYTELDNAGVLKQLKKNKDPDFSESLAWWKEKADGVDRGEEFPVKFRTDKTAEKVANILKKHEASALKRANEAGANIDSLVGRIGKQTYDPDKLIKEGSVSWIDKMYNTLDTKKSFPTETAQEIRDILQTTYTKITTGKVKKLTDGLGFANVAKGLNQKRSFHFKTPDGFSKMQKEFGTGSFFDIYENGLQNLSRTTALMEDFSPVPERVFEETRGKLKKQIIEQIEFTEKNGLTAELKQARKALKRIERKMIDYQFSVIDGSINIPGNHISARRWQNVRVFNNLRMLGGVLLSQLGDIPASGIEMQKHGGSLAGNMARQTANVAKFWMKGGRSKEFIGEMGIGIDGMIGAGMERFTPFNDNPGLGNKLQTMMFKWGGATNWNDATKTGVVDFASAHLARKLEGMPKFTDMEPKSRKMLQAYGIDSQAKYDLLKKGITKVDGQKMFDPSELQYLDLDEVAETFHGDFDTTDLPDAEVQKIKRRRAQKTINDLEDGMVQFFNDTSVRGVVTPTGAEKAIMTQGQAPGTFMGEFLRTIMQYKSFSISSYNKVLKPMMRDMDPKQPSTWKLPGFVVAAAVYGGMSVTLKDISKGRRPREFWKDPASAGKFFAASLAQSGGLGIIGDFMFGEFNRFGAGFLATAAGPTGSTIESLARSYSNIMAGKFTAAEGFRHMKSFAPFMNLFYIRGALDYLMLYDIQEALSPGFKRRMEKRLERENNQKMIFNP